jgi:uracil-DNA glycosylase
LNLKEEIIELLTHQKDVFGDDLYTKIQLSEIKYQKEVGSPLKVSEPKVKKVEEVQTISQFDKITNLDDFNNAINACQKCGLAETRDKFVFGAGNSNADLMIIGEAPGAEEDKQGIPFVGKAGKLLNDILKAIDFTREDVFIANILKCRPPNNRDPLPSERDLCKPYLYKQIDLINPKVILLLGKVAANVLLKNNESLTKMRGGEHEINGIKTMVTYHPAALLRNHNWKRPTWEDVQKVKKLYDELVES